MKKLILVIMVLLLVVTSAPITAYGAEDVTPSGIAISEIEYEIDALVREYLGVTTPGVAIIVMKDGEIIFSSNWGYADLENNILVDDDTVFEYGSIHKVFTFTAVMQLVEQGLIDLDAPISNYLPEDFYRQLNHTRPYTMRDVLNHAIGVEEVMFDGMSIIRSDEAMPEAIPTLEETLLNMNPEQIFTPNTVSAYSNWGTALAGLVVQYVSGQPFYQYQRDNIFASVGMANTAGAPNWSDNPGVANTMARGYLPDGDGGFDESGWYVVYAYPAGAARGTALDLARFALALMPQENETSPLFTSNETMHQMLSPSYDPTGDMIGTFHGFLNYYDGDFISVGHGGDTIGFSLDMAIALEYDFGFVLLQNAGDELSIRGGLHDLLIGPAVETSHPETSDLPDISDINATLVSARKMESTILEFVSYLGLVTITSAGDNQLALSMGEFNMVYEQVAPYEFQIIETDNLFLPQVMRRFTLAIEDGLITHVRIGAFDLIALPNNRTVPILIGSLGVTLANAAFFVLAPLALLIVAIVSKKKNKVPANPKFNKYQTLLTLSGLAFVVNSLSFIVMIATNPTQSFFWARNVMPWVSWLLLAIVAVLTGASVLALKKDGASLMRKVAFWITVMLIGLFIPVLFSWNFFVV